MEASSLAPALGSTVGKNALFSTHDCREASKPSAAVESVPTASLSYRRSERTALYIQTQEGDTVRLSIKVRDSLKATASADSETLLSEVEVSGRESRKIVFSVEGDLNAEERAAIRSVIAQASALAEDFFAGDLPLAFATAESLEFDGAELAQVGLRLSVREQLTYSGSGTYEGLAGDLHPPARSTAPAAAPVTEEAAPAPSETAPVAATAEVTETTDITEPTTVPPTADSFTTPAAHVLRAIGGFIAELLDSLAAPASGERDTEVGPPSIEMSLKLRVFQSMVFTLAAEQLPAADDETNAPGQPLLADILDALAARQQPIDARV